MLYVIAPVHNRVAVTTRFVDTLVQQTPGKFHLILVDDGCTDGTVAAARSRLGPDRLTVLTGNGDLWWAGALQLAYEHLLSRVADDDAVMTLNDDMAFEGDFLANGLAALAARPTACIQAIGVDRSTGTVDRGAVADLVRLRFRAAEPGEAVNCLSTRGLMMSGRTWLSSGGFRPRWLPHYLSDYEFTLRLRRRGTPLAIDERFRCEVAFELTGLDQASSRNTRVFLAQTLSNRAKFNPKHWSAFVVMTCPIWIAPVHLVRIWGGFVRSLLAVALRHRMQESS